MKARKGTTLPLCAGFLFDGLSGARSARTGARTGILIIMSDGRRRTSAKTSQDAMIWLERAHRGGRPINERELQGVRPRSRGGVSGGQQSKTFAPFETSLEVVRGRLCSIPPGKIRGGRRRFRSRRLQAASQRPGESVSGAFGGKPDAPQEDVARRPARLNGHLGPAGGTCYLAPKRGRQSKGKHEYRSVEPNKYRRGVERTNPSVQISDLGTAVILSTIRRTAGARKHVAMIFRLRREAGNKRRPSVHIAREHGTHPQAESHAIKKL